MALWFQGFMVEGFVTQISSGNSDDDGRALQYLI